MRLATLLSILVVTSLAATASATEIQHLTIAAHGHQRLATVALAAHTVTLELHPCSVRAPEFVARVQPDGGSIITVPCAPSQTYRGCVTEIADSRVAASLEAQQLTAMIVLPTGEVWSIEPLTRTVPAAAPSLHVVHRTGSLSEILRRCGGAVAPPFTAPTAPGTTTHPSPSPGGPSLKICEVAFDADVEFYRANGSSVSQTIADIDSVMNGINVIYERDVDITYTVTSVLVRTAEPDPYTSSDPGTLLGQLAAEWNTNQTGIARDVTHLMTGRDLAGGVIGIAYLSTICNLTSAYGLSQSRFTSDYSYRVGLTAHELGHNWSAQHCSGGDCRIMCPYIGGCAGDVSHFGAGEIDQITSFRDTRTCLTDAYPPLALPFLEPFASTTFDESRWSLHDNVVIDGNASNEPSPPYAAALNAASTTQQDDLRSRYVALASTPLATLSYAVEHRGVEVGESLVIEYQADGSKWIELDRIVSDGSNQNAFIARSQYLPPGAYHDDFCLRLRTEVSSSDDTWYVDDVQITAVDCAPPTHYGLATPGSYDITPRIDWGGSVPYVGNPGYQLLAKDMYGQKVGFLFTGFSRQTVDVGHGTYLNVLPPWLVFSFVVDGLPYPGYGSKVIPAPIPNDVALAGFHFMNFFLCADEGTPLGVSGTDGLDSTICQ